MLILHDQELVRAGLSALITADPGFEVVAESVDVPGAMRKARARRPGLLLLAPRGANRDALRAVPDLVAASKGRVVVLGEDDNPGLVRAALDAGAGGFLALTASAAELLAALRRVDEGESYIHPSAGARFVREERSASAAGEQLSDRERQVLALLALGHTSREMGEELKISSRTVEWHRQNIQQKLKLTSRAALTRFAIASGLVRDLARFKLASAR